MHSRVFAGEFSPNFDKLYVIEVEELSLRIHYGVLQYGDVDEHQSLSTSLFDPRLHGRVLQSNDVDIKRKALGFQGMYPQRNRCLSFGHCTFLCNKTKGSPSKAKPTEGPGMREHYLLHRQEIDTCYVPIASHIMRHLATTI